MTTIGKKRFLLIKPVVKRNTRKEEKDNKYVGTWPCVHNR